MNVARAPQLIGALHNCRWSMLVLDLVAGVIWPHIQAALERAAELMESVATSTKRLGLLCCPCLLEAGDMLADEFSCVAGSSCL
jgi:hypothetical protein